MSIRPRLASWLIVATLAILLAMSWTSIVLAQADGDGDGLDGDELGLPILIGVGIVAYLGWTAIRRWRKSP